ncbi:MAG: HAMP domain-containing sensor histidine kinase [Polyangiales bacterium]
MPEPSWDHVRAERVRAVGTRFLRARPWIAGVAVGVNGALLALSGAPPSQRLTLGPAMVAVVVAFALEARALRTRTVTDRWMDRSLLATAVAIAVGAALSGGARSPMLPLLFAPVGVSFAAFGDALPSRRMLALALGLVAALGLAPLSAMVRSPYDIAMTVVSSAAAMVLLAVGVTGLVSAHQRAGEALDAMREASVREAASRAREVESVGARVAHELRNPLSSVRGLVQLLSRREHDARDARRFEVALSELERAESIVRDYLDFARPLTSFDPEALDLGALAREVVTAVEPRASAAGVSLRVEGSARAEGDPRRLREALVNLAVNAVEATPRGGVVTVTVREDPSGATLAVLDAGPGVDPSLLGRVGEAFATTKAGGTGVGLSHAAAVARMHGGTLALTPRPAGGTAATLTLPHTAKTETCDGEGAGGR